MSKYPLYEHIDYVWYRDNSIDSSRGRWMTIGGIEIAIGPCTEGGVWASADYIKTGLPVRGCDKPMRFSTFDEAEAALLAAVEAADKPEWIDLPSGLAAMCEWRGWTMSVGKCTSGNGWWFHVCDGSGGGADADKFVNMIDAELAAEAWVREQTGKDNVK